MSTRHWVVTALAAGHLLLVACSAARVHLLLPATPPGRALCWYGAVSGADMGYGFFAPSVGSQLRARFVLTGPGGRTWEDDLETGHNREVKLRISGAVNLYLAGADDPAFQEDLLACWAAAMFGRHPEAAEVAVHVDVYDVPPMAAYRAGARPAWVPLGVTVFRRGQPLPSPEARSP